MTIRDLATGFHSITIRTRDLDETLLFYTEIGFELREALSDPESLRRIYYLELGDLLIRACEDENAPDQPGCMNTLSILVRDLDGVLDIVNKHGLNNTEDEIHTLSCLGGLRCFAIEGPNRERIEFTEVSREAD